MLRVERARVAPDDTWLQRYNGAHRYGPEQHARQQLRRLLQRQTAIVSSFARASPGSGPLRASRRRPAQHSMPFRKSLARQSSIDQRAIIGMKAERTPPRPDFSLRLVIGVIHKVPDYRTRKTLMSGVPLSISIRDCGLNPHCTSKHLSAWVGLWHISSPRSGEPSFR